MGAHTFGALVWGTDGSSWTVHETSALRETDYATESDSAVWHR